MIRNELWMEFSIGMLILIPVIILVYFNFGISIEFILYSILFSVLAFSGIGEIYDKKLDGFFTLTLMVAGGVLIFIKFENESFLLTESLYGMILSGFSFLCMYFISRGGLSLDNVALISFSGTILGFQQIMGVMFVMSILAAFSSIIYMLYKRKNVKSSLPSLIYIYLGCVVSLYSYNYSL